MKIGTTTILREVDKAKVSLSPHIRVFYSGDQKPINLPKPRLISRKI